VYFFSKVNDMLQVYQTAYRRVSKLKQLLLISLFSIITSILQSAGGFIPGVGYFISPFATAPILFCSMLNIPFGWWTYLFTNLLLLFFQPSELVIFPFTTGLLGLGLGIAFNLFAKRLSIIFFGACSLTIGICLLLYVFNFPVLGPAISHIMSIYTGICIFIFSFLYSWLWMEIGLMMVKKFPNSMI
jgi:hypothetical protein